MKRAWGAVLVATMVAFPSAAAASGQRYLVQFDGPVDERSRAAVEKHGGTVRHAFPSVRAAAVAMTAERAAALAREPGVTRVEREHRSRVMELEDAELVPSLDNGLYGLLTTRSVDVHRLGVTGAGVPVCVADTGVDADHPDIAPRYRGGVDVVDGDSDPDVPPRSHPHGTHVAGTALAALGGSGVRGVAHEADLHHARVLGEDGSGWNADVMAGVRELVEDRGCRVVNLSLGSSDASKIEEDFYAEMAARDVVVVASAGNSGTEAANYPAAYPAVISVAAVDRTNGHASFSTTHPTVELAAPGVDVLSATPLDGGTTASVQAGEHHAAQALEHAAPTDGLTTRLVDAGDGNDAGDFPAGTAGAIALIRRGGDTFAAKVERAMDAGAAGAIIHNNVAGGFSGTLGNPTTSTGASWIPAVSVSDTAGSALVAHAASGGEATLVSRTTHWTTMSGTSMAAPHVAGVAALLLSGDDPLSAAGVRRRLAATAVDLGAAGRDSVFGHGLVDAFAAITDVCTLRGTPGSDTLLGTGGDDVLCGFGGDDRLVGGGGTDRFLGGDGADTIVSLDGRRETRIACDAGVDALVADPDDTVPADCERALPPGG